MPNVKLGARSTPCGTPDVGGPRSIQGACQPRIIGRRIAPAEHGVEPKIPGRRGRRWLLGSRCSGPCGKG